MMNMQALMTATQTAAAIKNAQYSSTKSHVRSIKERWDETYNNLSTWNQEIVDNLLEQAKSEFRRRNPNHKTWTNLSLAEAKMVIMSAIKIDGTMQRQLDIFWVLQLLNQFASTMVVPIQVYRPDNQKEEFLAWDGQHTIVLLWLIATHLFEEDPDKIYVPVNLYHSNLKAEMRANFISLNSKEGKKMLEAIDLWQQMIFGVRIDGSKNPAWVATEEKQRYIEGNGLFVTSKKFNDHMEPGAISRLQEINKLEPESVKWLSKYLMLSTKLQRPVGEKELVMMGHYFDRCRIDNITVDDAYVTAVYNAINKHWKCEFDPNGTFWIKASNAYHNWHNTYSSSVYPGKFKKEPVHGFPYLISQLKKTLKVNVPSSDSNSNFIPMASDLE